MQAGALRPIVDRTGRESAKHQFVRELLKNAMEAGATRAVIRPEWNGVESLGVYRFLIADDGIGMPEERLPDFLNTFGGGGKPIGDVHENFGMGAKTSMLPWNHAGMIVASRQNGHTWAVRLELDPSMGIHGEYGLHRWEVQDEDGLIVYEEVLDLDVQDDEFPLGPGVTVGGIRQAFIDDDHGTVVIALGMTGGENTFLSTGEGGVLNTEGDIKGVSKYINERFWDLPVDVEVHELRTQKSVDWPRSASEAYGPQGVPDRRVNVRRVRGARYWLEEGDYLHPDSGVLETSDGTRIHWYLWHAKQERKMIHSYARRHGYLAVLYEGELYHLGDHPFAYRRFGIVGPDVRQRLTLIIQPPREDREQAVVGAYPHAARSSLYWSGAHELPYDTWATEFIDNLPEPIRKAIVVSGSSEEQDPESGEWLEQISAKFRSRFRRLRLVVRAGGKARAVPNTPGGSPAGPIARSHKHEPGGGGSGGSDGPIARARSRSKDGIEAEERVVKEGLPPFRWTTADEVGAPGRAAVWVARSARTGRPEILINREFPAFVEIFQYWLSEYPPHYENDVKKVVEIVYGTELSSKVGHAHELQGQKEWTKDDFSELISPESLTLAVMGLYSCHQVISTMLGGRLGRGSSKKKGAA